MSKQVNRRRGTSDQHAEFVGAAGELTVDTTKNTVVVHDGQTPGGHPLAKEAEAIIQAQQYVMHAGDLPEYMKRVPMIGARQPRELTTATGLWYGGHTTHGDWSGTLQERKDGTFGSGGPAELEYAPSGQYTLFNAGRMLADGSPRGFYTDTGLPSPDAGATYGVAVRRAWARRANFTGATWSPASLQITFTSSPAFTFTGNDWMAIHCLTNLTDQEVIDNDICVGWYRLASYNSTTKKATLTADESYRGPTFCPNTLNGVIDGTLFQANDCAYYTGVTYDAGALRKVGANFPSPGPDDTVELEFDDGTYNYAKILARVSPAEITITDELDGTITGNMKLFTRGSFEKVGVIDWVGANAPNAWVSAGSPQYQVMHVQTSPLSSSPQWGDMYFIYYTGGVTPAPETHPEDVPTLTSDYTLSSWWPYFSAVKSTHTSGKSVSGNGNNLAAETDSDMNHYWWGSFCVPRSTFLNGSIIDITTVMDVTYFGTPFFIEVLVIPNFDPEADWIKDHAGFGNKLRIHNDMVYMFQSSILRGVEQQQTIAPMWIRLTGQSGYIQTIGVQQGLNPGPGDNSSQQWRCEFLFGPPGSDGAEETHFDRFPSVKGPLSHIQELDDEPLTNDFTNNDIMYTVLIKSEHASLYGYPGYHGHYSGEPFSCTTGNGGVLLHHPGNLPTAVYSAGSPAPFSRALQSLPWGGRFRVGTFRVEWRPGGE